MNRPAGINTWLKSWVLLCLLKRAPQDDPRSPAALAGALLFYGLVTGLQAHVSVPWTTAIGMTLLDLLVLVGFGIAVLAIRGLLGRLPQTLTALAGAGGVLGLVALPLMQGVQQAQQSRQGAGILIVLWLLAMAWSIAVPAHIYRHALSVRFPVGALLAIFQAVLLVKLVDVLFLSVK